MNASQGDERGEGEDHEGGNDADGEDEVCVCEHFCLGLSSGPRLNAFPPIFAPSPGALQEGGAGEADAVKEMEIKDMTNTNMLNLRRTIFLTVMSSVNFEECVHKVCGPMPTAPALRAPPPLTPVSARPDLCRACGCPPPSCSR